MINVDQDKESLLNTLISEASDVDLICYLARTEGVAVLRDLLECVADAHAMSPDDIVYNIRIVREKKLEASGHPMFAALHRLLHPQPGVRNGCIHAAAGKRPDLSAEIRLH